MTSIGRYWLHVVVNVWVSSKLGKAMSVVVSSAVQLLRPLPVTKRKREYHVVEKAHERRRRKALLHQVGRWCEDLDEFGTMIWMATTLDPHRRRM